MMPFLPAEAQQLEMGPAGASTTAMGPSSADQTVTLMANTGISGFFSSTTPAFTTTLKLSNQAYLGGVDGMSFGSALYGASIFLYVRLNNYGSPLSSYFTSSPNTATAGTGIDVATNYGTSFFVDVDYLASAAVRTDGRYYFGDLTFEFSQAVLNPVIHIAGVGGAAGTLGFFNEFELSASDVAAGINLTRLSGSTYFTLDTNSLSILNSSPLVPGASGEHSNSQLLGSSGSVRINSGGRPVKNITFRVYLRGNGGGTSWFGGDVSTLATSVNLLNVSGNVYRDADALTDGTVNGIGTNVGGSVFVNLVDSTTNTIIATAPVDASGVYSISDVPSSSYYLMLANTAGTVGATVTAATYPPFWFPTGEHAGSGAGSDSTVDGQIKVTLTTDLTDINFGINTCSAGTTAPLMDDSIISNICPLLTANLNTAFMGVIPPGAALLWFDNSTHTGSAYATPATAAAGTYYAFYYDAFFNCYSPASSSVRVALNQCYQPVAENIMNASVNNSNAQSPLASLKASDASGTPIVSYTALTIPPVTQGVLYTCSTNDVPCSGTYTAVSVNQVLSPAQSTSLYFDPAKTFMGLASFSYNAVNSNGTSNIANVGIPVHNHPPTVSSFTTGRTPVDTPNVEVPPLNYADGDGTVISVTIIPPAVAQGTLTYCAIPPSVGCGTLISTTTTLTPAQANTLHFTPASGFKSYATFQYRVTDDNNLQSDKGTVTIPVTPYALDYGANLPPVAQNVVNIHMNTSEPVTLTSNLVGTDPDGSVVKYSIVSIPAPSTGVLYYCTSGDYPCTGSLNAVTPGKDLTPSQAATLQFDPLDGNNSAATFTYTVTDDDTALSNISTFTIPVYNAAPVVQNITAYVPKNSTHFPVPALNGFDMDGSVTSYSIQSVPNSATEGTIYYCSSGSYPCSGLYAALTAGAVLTPSQAATISFTPVSGYTGTATAAYTATDNNGNQSIPATIRMIVNEVPVSGTSPLSAGMQVKMNAGATNTYLPVNFLSAVDFDGTIQSYSILAVPSTTEGRYYYCSSGVKPCSGSASLLSAGTTLSAAQAATLSFTPGGNYMGPAALSFYAHDNTGNISGTSTSVVHLINTPPVSKGYTAPVVVAGGSGVSTPFSGTDADGTVVQYRVTSIPDDSMGKLTYCLAPPSTGCSTAVTGPVTLTPAQAATVSFTPAARVRVSEVPFSYTTIDNLGTSGNVAFVLVPISVSTPLPLLLKYFTVTSHDCMTVLNWAVANLHLIRLCEVYRSTDGGRNFELIHSLQAGGDETFNLTTDGRADALYHIKLIESDGTASYSATQSAVSDCSDASVKMYPNPCADKVNIIVPGTGAETAYALYDMTGRMFLQGVLQSGRVHEMNVSGLPSGAYMIRLERTGGVEMIKLSVAK